MMTIPSSPHAPREDSRATNRAACVHDTNRPYRALPSSGSHHAERDGDFGQEMSPMMTISFRAGRSLHDETGGPHG